MRPIQVLYYEQPEPGRGGSRVSLCNLIRGLSDRVVAYVMGPLPEEIRRSLPPSTVLLRPPRIWPPRTPSRFGRVGKTVRWWCYFLGTAARLAAIILRRRIDVVHANNHVHSNAPAVLAARLTGRPCVCHLRGTQRPRLETRWLFRYVDRFVAISAHVRDHYARLGLLGGRPTAIIYNGIDVEALAQRLAERPASHEGAFEAGLFARMVEFKGHRYFLEVAREAVPLAPGIRFVIHGPIPGPGDPERAYYDSVCESMKAMGLDGCVRFQGPFADVAEVMRRTDAALGCSPYDNFGRVLFESMACGVPFVAFDSGGTREVAVAGRNALLVPNRDTAAMAEAVVRLFRDDALRDQLVREGRETAARLFDYRANAQQVWQVYESLIVHRRTHAGRVPDEHP